MQSGNVELIKNYPGVGKGTEVKDNAHEITVVIQRVGATTVQLN